MSIGDQEDQKSANEKIVTCITSCSFRRTQVESKPFHSIWPDTRPSSLLHNEIVLLSSEVGLATRIWDETQSLVVS